MSLTVCTANYTAVLDALTAETYILVITRGNVRESKLLLSFSVFERRCSTASLLVPERSFW